jgi:hypothetical protein
VYHGKLKNQNAEKEDEKACRIERIRKIEYKK